MSRTIRMRVRAAAVAASFLAAASLSAETQPTARTTLRGWLTDEACANGRANGGKYTGGNPDCAKACVAKGERTVLALPDEKRLIVVANPEIARDAVGDYVEVTGTLEGGALKIGSLTTLEEGVAKCAAPARKR